MTIDHACQICEQPCEESAFACARCASAVARFLEDATLAGEVDAVVALQTRHSASGGSRAPEPTPSHADDPQRRSERPETFAWGARRELPLRGALRPTRLPINLAAAERAATAFGALTTWARVVENDRGEPVPEPRRGEHPAAVAARYLTGHLTWIRSQRFAAEALADLRSAGGAIRQIVDSPPAERFAGTCECGAFLYAREGAATVACRNCDASWDVETSRQNLWDALPEYLFTASECGLLLMIYGIGKQDRRRWAKTITMWAARGHIAAHGEIDGAPLYLFRDVQERATRSQDKPAA